MGVAKRCGGDGCAGEVTGELEGGEEEIRIELVVAVAFDACYDVWKEVAIREAAYTCHNGSLGKPEVAKLTGRLLTWNVEAGAVEVGGVAHTILPTPWKVGDELSESRRRRQQKGCYQGGPSHRET